MVGHIQISSIKRRALRTTDDLLLLVAFVVEDVGGVEKARFRFG